MVFQDMHTAGEPGEIKYRGDVAGSDKSYGFSYEEQIVSCLYLKQPLICFHLFSYFKRLEETQLPKSEWSLSVALMTFL